MRKTSHRVLVVPIVVAVLAVTAGGARAHVWSAPPPAGAPVPASIAGTWLAPDSAFSPSQIDERGRIVGQRHANGEYEICRYEQGRLTPLTAPTVPGTYLAGVMNRRGDAAGTVFVSGDEVRPYLWSGGRARDLGALGSAEVVALSDRGHLLVQPRPRPSPADIFDPALRPRVWKDGRLVVSPAPPPGTIFQVPEVFATEARDSINASGLVVGWLSRIENGYPVTSEAAVWRPGGALVGLGGFGGESRPVFVTDAGEVVGWSVGAYGRSRVFVWRAGRGMTDIGTPDAEGRALRVEAANDRGHLVVANELTRYLWHDGTFTEIGPSQAGQVARMNNRDQVILIGDVVGSTARAAYVWQAGQLINLHSDDPEADRWDTMAVDINDRGVVVGYIEHGFENYRALRWDVPPPAGPAR